MNTKRQPRGSAETRSEMRILLADDEPVTLRMYRKFLEDEGFEVLVAQDGESALRLMDASVRVAVLDLNMPGMSGLECLTTIRGEYPETEVLIVSGVGQVRDAVQAMKAGACEFVTKPCDRDDLIAHVEQAVRTAELRRENHELRSAVEPPVSGSRFAATTDAAKELVHKVSRLAELDSTVLLTGESGTGKTTLARMIHNFGPRREQPFVAVNCASLPRDLIEAELFGHVKGAFTGAASDRPGRAEIADSGTLFLDEIGDLPLELQPKLLTFLQEKTIQRIGSNREIQVDVRLVAATHQDLEAMCSQRRFRPDLYYRLNVLHVDVPPLRERRGDVPALAEAVLERIAARRKSQAIELGASAKQLLQQHDWPGNIRELENCLERASAFCDGHTIRAEDLDLKLAVYTSDDSVAPSSIVGLTLKELEKRALVAALEAYNGNKAMAARELGISEKSIYNKLKRFGLFDS